MSCESLKVLNRTLRTLPGRLLLGPTGARLGADYLDPVAGFAGRIDFIHKMNIPLLFSVTPQDVSAFPPHAQAVWYPDRLDMQQTCARYALEESKWITWEDAAVSCQLWRNTGRDPLVLRLNLPDGSHADETGWLWQTPVSIHGIQPVFLIGSSVQWTDGCYVIAPGQEAEIVLCAAGVLPGEEERLAGRVNSVLSAPPDELRQEQRTRYDEWFMQAPQFECSHPLLQRCWDYRWYILRTCLCRPDTGLFHHTAMYEGRSHKVVKDPYAPSGWEFTKLVPLSTPLHVSELRWHQDDTAKEVIRSLVDSADEKGMWRCLYADEQLADYANASAHSLYQLYLSTGDRDFIAEVLPAFKRNCMAVYETYKGQNDHLQVEYVHQRTGKEYQPSYWYFAEEYPDHVNKHREGYTPLKRVDRSVYCYLDFMALSRLCAALGDPDEARFAQLAQAVRTDVLEKMWDEETHFFYDLHHLDDRKAMVKNIVGVYPFWAAIADERHDRALNYLSDENAFATGSAFASVSADCPVFSACGGWKGDFFKGRNGCVWNGPSWPYTTAIALDALAEASLRTNHRYDGAFARFLHEYTLQHFTGCDPSRPYLVEHYDSITGEPLSDEPDYNHSYYIDLIVRRLAGVLPAESGFTFDPIDCGVEQFALRNLLIRGHRVGVQLAHGSYTVTVDDEVRYSGPGGRAVSINL